MLGNDTTGNGGIDAMKALLQQLQQQAGAKSAAPPTHGALNQLLFGQGGWQQGFDKKFPNGLLVGLFGGSAPPGGDAAGAGAAPPAAPAVAQGGFTPPTGDVPTPPPRPQGIGMDAGTAAPAVQTAAGGAGGLSDILGLFGLAA